MNLKPMLARLESAMGRHNLSEQMVLVPEPKVPISKKSKSTKSVNFVVGYNSSPKSQTALDITLCIAHQTRLATSKEVTVQVVYVIDEISSHEGQTICDLYPEEKGLIRRPRPELETTAVLTKTTQHKGKSLTATRPSTSSGNNHFEHADRLLWQARCLADEWRGLFKAHLRFGQVATELRKVVEQETATLLFLGCETTHHPLVQKLGRHFPCSVLGIPPTLNLYEEISSESFSKVSCGLAAHS